MKSSLKEVLLKQGVFLKMGKLQLLVLGLALTQMWNVCGQTTSTPVGLSASSNSTSNATTTTGSTSSNSTSNATTTTGSTSSNSTSNATTTTGSTSSNSTSNATTTTGSTSSNSTSNTATTTGPTNYTLTPTASTESASSNSTSNATTSMVSTSSNYSSTPTATTGSNDSVSSTGTTEVTSTQAEGPTPGGAIAPGFGKQFQRRITKVTLKTEDYIAIGISSSVCAILLIVCIVLSGKECARQRRRDSFSMTGINPELMPSYFHIGLDEYSLTKIPRPQTHYMDQSNDAYDVSAGEDNNAPNLGTGNRNIQVVSDSPRPRKSPVPKPRESIKRKDDDRTVIVRRNPYDQDPINEGVENTSFTRDSHIYDSPSAF
ncbi:uncharacterized protein LOC141914932 [Tubulanus polymorphus]|uniref:uncharacterized protein LOC141914932 n=1 Tax=Tubulanus polymorphus TaxID=672921 RepID=UPI003DA424AC